MKAAINLLRISKGISLRQLLYQRSRETLAADTHMLRYNNDHLCRADGHGHSVCLDPQAMYALDSQLL
jgi:hypothetical protein